jgi:hypothetical protein
MGDRAVTKTKVKTVVKDDKEEEEPKATVLRHGPKRFRDRASFLDIVESYSRLEQEIKIDFKFGDVVHSLKMKRRQLSVINSAKVFFTDIMKRKPKIDEEVEKSLAGMKDVVGKDEIAAKRWLEFERRIMKDEPEYLKFTIDIDAVLKLKDKDANVCGIRYDGKDNLVNNYMAWLILTNGAYTPISSEKVLTVRQLCSILDGCGMLFLKSRQGVLSQLDWYFKNGAGDESKLFSDLVIACVTDWKMLNNLLVEAKKDETMKLSVKMFMDRFYLQKKQDKTARLFIMESGDRWVEYTDDDLELKSLINERYRDVDGMMLTCDIGDLREKIDKITPSVFQVRQRYDLVGWDNSVFAHIICI